MNKGKFIDTTRMFISPPENVFTWWSYRSKDFKKIIEGEGWIIFGLQIIKKLSLLMQKL